MPRSLSARALFLLPLFAVPFVFAACGARLGDAHSLAGGRGAVPARFAGAEGSGAGLRPRPTVRDLREAKGAAMQEWDSLINGGLPQYRGDGSSSNINSVKFSAAPAALTVDYYAEARLNMFGGEPHPLTLVVYHLTDRAAFDQLARHEEGIRKLLEGEYFDASVAGARVHSIQPGACARLVEDRYEGGRYVALVAGYGAGLRARTAVYVTEYRLYQWYTAGGSVLSRDRAMYSPHPLRLRAVLDETEMRVDDTDAALDRMREVASMQRSQLFSRLRPAYRSEAAGFMRKGKEPFLGEF